MFGSKFNRSSEKPSLATQPMNTTATQPTSNGNSKQAKAATEYDAMLNNNSAYIPLAIRNGARELKPNTVSPTTNSTADPSSNNNNNTKLKASAPPSTTGWRTAICPRSNKPYYWNVHTRESKWKKPLELASEEEKDAITSKEQELKMFFASMERNVLKRLENNEWKIDADGNANAPTESASDFKPTSDFKPSSASTNGSSKDGIHQGIHQSWTRPTTSSPTTNNKDDWIAGWITPTSESSHQNSPGNLSLASMEGLSVFDAASVNTCDTGLNSFCGSLSSLSREERDDKVYPLKSKIERIKSSSSRPVIDKPNLIRTISKMEYDLLMVHQLNPGRQTGADMCSSPKLRKTELMQDVPLTPTTETCGILSSLHLTLESEGLNVSLDTSAGILMAPTSPLTPVSPHESEDALPLRSLSSPANIAKPNLTKRNTCGTMYLGSTLSAPDKDALIKCVCGVYRAHLLQSELHATNSSNYDTDANSKHFIFHDRRAPGDYRQLDTCSIPSLSDVTDFYRSIFLRSQMEVDCIIISLIYIERLIKMTAGELTPKPSNWRSILFSCMVLASKVWDDLSMWNCDFSKIGPCGMTFSLARTNELEICLLRALEYKVKVNASEYAKYYFLLRGMLCRSGLANDELTRLRPLDAKGALKMAGETSTAGSDGVGEAVAVSASVAKASMKERSKSYGIPDAKRDGGGALPLESSGSGSPSSKRMSLEQIVRM